MISLFIVMQLSLNEPPKPFRNWIVEDRVTCLKLANRFPPQINNEGKVSFRLACFKFNAEPKEVTP